MKIFYILTSLSCLFLSVVPCKAETIEKLFKKYLQPSQAILSNKPSPTVNYISNCRDFTKSLNTQNWKYSHLNYELNCPEKSMIAKNIYGLAIFTGDISSDIKYDDFEKGVQGYHYRIEQVTQWINSILSGSFTLKNPEEFFFISNLIENSAIVLINGVFESGNIIRHISGAAPGTKRSLEININHERLHIILDEEPSIGKEAAETWNKLPDKTKIAYKNKLKSYLFKTEETFLKEWYVRENEINIEVILKNLN